MMPLRLMQVSCGAGSNDVWEVLRRLIPPLLRDAVPEQKDRMRILAVLGDKTMGQVEGLHLTLASLDARVVDATLPLLATFDEVQQSLPSKAVMDSVDLLDLPGYFASIGVEHLLRHQVVALLSCVLLSVSEERRLGWCRFGGVHHRFGHVGSGGPFVGCSHT